MLKAIILDVDGVIVNGQTIIKNADNVIEWIRKNGMKVFLLSNNSRRSRASLVEKLNRIGLKMKEEEVYSASYAAAEYIHEKWPNSKVFAVSDGIEEELKLRGIKVVDSKDADVVVVGLDKDFTYKKLLTGFYAIMKGAKFVAANDDANYSVENGLMPGAGGIVGAFKGCTEKNPIVVGKPTTRMLEIIMHEHGFKKEEMVMVGDRIDTDIGMAKNAEIKSVLVLTGVSKKQDLEGKEEIKPDWIIESVSELPELIIKINHGQR
ncbi:HAD-IIA family hydrolase [Candidatus Micrarchaeota archaeon]|nr:HAD-IIA family hydrolase [Candidatus Micrarchaeota archaeon]